MRDFGADHKIRWLWKIGMREVPLTQIILWVQNIREDFFREVYYNKLLPLKEPGVSFLCYFATMRKNM